MLAPASFLTPLRLTFFWEGGRRPFKSQSYYYTRRSPVGDEHCLSWVGLRDVSGRQRGVLVGQSMLTDRVKGATAVEQRICHVLRSVEAEFVDQGPLDSGQWHVVADVGSSGVEAVAQGQEGSHGCLLPGRPLSGWTRGCVATCRSQQVGWLLSGMDPWLCRDMPLPAGGAAAVGHGPVLVSRHAAPSRWGGRCRAWTRGCVATRQCTSGWRVLERVNQVV